MTTIRTKSTTILAAVYVRVYDWCDPCTLGEVPGFRVVGYLAHYLTGY